MRTYKVRRPSEAQNRIARIFRPRVAFIEALRDVSFSIDEGEAVGYIGANGAGKTTTFKILAGILSPSGGTVRVGGANPFSNRKQASRQLGYLSGHKGHLWWDLPIRDSYDLLRRIYGIADDRFRTRLADLVELMDLADQLETPARQLSLGTRTRAELVATLLHSPTLALLDEPTIGLDVLAKDRIYEFLKTVRRDLGTTIVLSSHDLRDVEAVCDRLLLLDRGRLLFDGTPDELLARFGGVRRLRIESATPDVHPSLPPDFIPTTSSGLTHEYEFDPRTTSIRVVLDLLRDDSVRDFTVESAPLSDVVRAIYATGFTA